MNETVMLVAVDDIKQVCEGEPDVIKRLEKAMKKAQDFWLSTDDDLRFRAACAAAMVTGNTSDRERIVRSIKVLRALSAMLSGVPVNVADVLTQADEDAIPLKKMWLDAKKGDRSAS